MRKSINVIVLPVITIIAALFLRCTQYAGGSEIGNPAVLAGVIVDSLGNGVSGVKLYLIDPLEKDPLKLVPDSCYHAQSNTKGEYSFSAIYEGTYNLFGSDSSGNKSLFTQITVDIEKAVNQDSGLIIVNDTETLTGAGYVVLDIPEPLSGSSFIYVPGTLIRAEVDSSGEYIIKCPQSTIDICYYGNDSTVLLACDIHVISGKWIDLTGRTIDVQTPGIVSGLLTGVTARVYTFTAGSVSQGLNYPVQYRFDWGDTVSLWCLSNQASHAWSTPGEYQVRVQAGSVRDTSSVSDWSGPVKVIIE